MSARKGRGWGGAIDPLSRSDSGNEAYTPLPLPVWDTSYALPAMAVSVVAVVCVAAAVGDQRPDLLFLLLGILWICSYLLVFAPLRRSFHGYSSRQFEYALFGTAAVLRLTAVVVMFWSFRSATGIPFEFHASDSLWYHQSAMTVAANLRDSGVESLFSGVRAAPSDLGYVAALGGLYALAGSDVLVVRVIQALIGAWSAVLLYRTARMCVGDNVAKTVGVLAALNPYLIYYCGLHLKETLMVHFITEVFYRTVRMSHHVRGVRRDLPVLVSVIAALFFFRTFLAVLLAGAVTLHFARGQIVRSYVQRVAVAAAVMVSVVGFAALLVPQLGEEVVTRVESGADQWERKLAVREERLGQSLTAAWVSRPAFIVAAAVGPLPSIVAIDGQENSIVQFGFAWLRHVFLLFAVLGLMDVLRTKKNRGLTVIAATLIGYVVILGAAGLPSSHRLQVPTLAAWTVLTGVGLHIGRPRKALFQQWFVVLAGVAALVVMWNYFKVAIRGY